MSITVEHMAGDSFRIRIGRHALVVDQPTEDGGWDLGPTPTELFVASLGGCVAYYAERFLVRHGRDPDGLTVHCGFTMSERRPARVERVDLHVEVATELSEKERAALQAVVEHCTVHNSLREPPEVRIMLAAAEQAA
jgi:putative redox protein